MFKQDRFLASILIGIGLLIVVALALFFIRSGTQAYQPDDTPSGVVNNYILALYQGDYERAFSYLAEGDNKPDLARFRSAFTSKQMDITNTALEIGEENVTSDHATVAVTLINNTGGLFSEAYRNIQNAELVRQSGSWKISNMPYPYWAWDWYQPNTVPAKPVPGG